MPYVVDPVCGKLSLYLTGSTPQFSRCQPPNCPLEISSPPAPSAPPRVPSSGVTSCWNYFTGFDLFMTLVQLRLFPRVRCPCTPPRYWMLGRVRFFSFFPFTANFLPGKEMSIPTENMNSIPPSAIKFSSTGVIFFPLRLKIPFFPHAPPIAGLVFFFFQCTAPSYPTNYHWPATPPVSRSGLSLFS